MFVPIVTLAGIGTVVSIAPTIAAVRKNCPADLAVMLSLAAATMVLVTAPTDYPVLGRAWAAIGTGWVYGTVMQTVAIGLYGKVRA